MENTSRKKRTIEGWDQHLLDTFIEYETSTYWWLNFLPFNWGTGILVRMVERKCARYYEFLRNRKKYEASKKEAMP